MNLIVNFNKPAGITSQQAVTRIKRILRAKKAGHAGTLDPMATGVLLVCINEATKIARFLTDMDKEYKARGKFGETTDTYDAEGRVVEKKSVPDISINKLNEIAKMFVGVIMQKPPMFSAVKIGGEALYKLARKGIEIERPLRKVHIYDMEIKGLDLPFVDISVSCSKGTYIRTICHDIGIKLGIGAHLVALERTRIGDFHIRDAAGFSDLSADDLNTGTCSTDKDRAENSVQCPRYFIHLDRALAGLQAVCLGEIDYRKALHGMKIPFGNTQGALHNEFVRLFNPAGNLFGIGMVQGDHIKVERILNL